MNNTDLKDEDENDDMWCFCGRPTFGEMIACENPSCACLWYHYQCVGLVKAPAGTWYCPDCLQIPGMKR